MTSSPGNTAQSNFPWAFTVNLLMLFIAWDQANAAKESAKSAAQQVALATKQADDAAMASANANATSARMVELQQEQYDDALTRSLTPQLVVPVCCNQIPINVVRPRDRFELRRLNREQSLWYADLDERERRLGSAYVFEILNVGPGVAFAVKVNWKIDKVILDDNREWDPGRYQDENQIIYFARRHVIDPRTSVNSTLLPIVPPVVDGHNIKFISGQIEMTCNDVTGREHRSSQPFTCEVIPFDDDSNGIGPRLSLHVSPEHVARELKTAIGDSGE